jgi:hypothetical protein
MFCFVEDPIYTSYPCPGEADPEIQAQSGAVPPEIDLIRLIPLYPSSKVVGINCSSTLQRVEIIYMECGMLR